MKEFYYDEYVNDDEVSDEEILDDLDPNNHNIILDDPELYDVDDDDDNTNDEITNKPQVQEVLPKTLLAALRAELVLKEFDRGSLSFKKDGVEYEGVPMLEINPNKFVFKLEPDGKLKSFNLSDIQVFA